ncbi:universal stress protein [Arthrobacter sp. NIO-1057]|uniref:universal stress protein n=1 Tax=Arthrobacter sp. NIO-1057 TaxID=993071 RepID=UPI00071D4571|nr:universal stress protein [Arthrobacter sp. NIO-1057]KSU66403.1 universal stress protein UspA [Arthrobacter sp. NIO-1057]SCC13340.1 Nucleotide-binding universal stress protein, UspA family [Arthrobacter sp. NIO-1057]
MTIVVGYIPSEEGEAALATAIDEAQRRNARLVVVNSSKGDQLVDDRLIDAKQYHELEARLTQSGVDFWIERKSQGIDAADQILQVAEAQRAQLIVIGLRKRTAMGKFLMGSVAQRVLLQAGCPVLSLKASNDW